MICNSLKNQWKNFTCESEPSTESKLCQEMLKVTSEESIAKDCQEVCLKKPNIQNKPDGRICFNLYLAIQRSTPKLGENGHGLPPKITNAQKLDEYDTIDDDENEGKCNFSIMYFTYSAKKYVISRKKLLSNLIIFYG